MRRGSLIAVAGVAALLAATASRAALACWEVADVVGYRRCSSFGEGWDVTHRAPTPPLWGLRHSPFARHSYRPGRLLGTDLASSGSRRIGCVDVRVAWAVDARVPASSIVLVMTFGNACDGAVPVAFGNVRVNERLADGTQVPLSLYDPASEVHRAVVDGRDEARESFEFDGADRRRGAPASVCVDLSGLGGGGPTEDAVGPVCLTRAAEPVDEHEVIGHNWHFPFGAGWDLPAFYFFAEIGAFGRPSGLGDDTLHGETSAGQKYAFGGSPYARVMSWGSDYRLGLRVAGPLYAGLTWRFAAAELPSESPLAASNGASVVTDRSFVNLGAGGFLGALVRRIEGVRLRADVTAGVQGDLVGVRQPPGNCLAGPRCPADAVRPIVEPRVALEAWLNPWWSLSAWIADDVLRPAAPAVGLSFAFHLRSYDGAP